jgi:hypothetical protein
MSQEKENEVHEQELKDKYDKKKLIKPPEPKP